MGPGPPARIGPPTRATDRGASAAARAGAAEVPGRARDPWRPDDQRVGCRQRRWSCAMPSPEDARRLLCALGDHIRHAIVGARGTDIVDLAAIEGATVADTIYAIDRIADDTLLDWFEQHWPGVEVVSEGLDEPVVVRADVEGDAEWTVIVDTIDGTRGLMYDKRAAWCLAAVAPRGGSLRDVVAAAMTELPTTKQGAADQLSGIRGGALCAERIDLRDHSRTPFSPRPSAATDLEHGFAGLAKFFPAGKPALAVLEGELFARLGSSHVFDDEY